MVLLALVRLGDHAYGVTIREEIEARAGRSISVAATYTALERLGRRDFVQSWTSQPTAVRGGRAKKHFRICPAGVHALRESKRVMANMWDGLETHPDLQKP